MMESNANAAELIRQFSHDLYDRAKQLAVLFDIGEMSEESVSDRLEELMIMQSLLSFEMAQEICRVRDEIRRLMEE
ncbi:hypothetical protein [Streptomyces halobius]|uniref:Uncharacterized protein n=1 Tax=Streptomyces halobius TaxID=2879846 RepID=A0ABY4M773_9ACTN|nr:hypothetical protein [Streptomyces halobius]UQA92669.1 hypothetical protein K9S39_13275 [Streptomyces halobius]